jgi:hypothetical protein
VFGGLTIDQNRYADRNWSTDRNGEKPMPADLFKGYVRRWCRDSERALGRPIKAVIAVEYQRNGWPHAHPLIDTGEELRARYWGPNQRYGDIATLAQEWYRTHGYARLSTPRNAGAVASYAAKYLSKGLDEGDVIIWPLTGRLVED